MGVLDDVVGMKKQGYADSDIVNALSRQGVSPKEINDALKQAEIKNAVSDYGYEGMEQSVMQGEDMAVPLPQNGQMYQQEYAPQEQQQQYAQPEYAPQEPQYYQPGGYEQYAAPSPSSAIDTDTVMEISDQVFSDKIKKFQKVLDATSEAAIVLQSKFENISERLKKIEMTMDKLQIAILEKVGSYGTNLESIKKEMSMMSDSFSKMVSPRESHRQVEKITEYSEEKSESPKRVSKKK
ncbi:MAG: hypothetical protein PHQ66_00660 [Candidatus Nanoarchaeia archaeon]|nr:hypothetical protein [Candidatus Nanoarchaeia archaeon]MDD5358511.1 hypothetical protein [Candidatus Nanoarchaeia archaeon]MDD5589025.1 hypothetical protein [Candidatus Nanoarchaeia archaeon]